MATTIQLVPVVEIEPGRMSERSSPQVAYNDQTRDEWEAWRRSCLHDGGLDLEPFPSGSWLYPVTAFGPAELAVLLRLETEKHDVSFQAADDPLEVFGALCGGIVLVVDDEVVLTPSCCADLGAGEWRGVLESRPPEWSDIWVGHDGQSLAVRFDEDTSLWDLRLGPWMEDEVERELAIADAPWLDAFEKLLEKLDGFAGQIASQLPAELQPEMRQRLGGILAGLQG